MDNNHDDCVTCELTNWISWVHIIIASAAEFILKMTSLFTDPAQHKFGHNFKVDLSNICIDNSICGNL